MSFQLSARPELGKSSFNLPQMDGDCLCVAICFIYLCAIRLNKTPTKNIVVANISKNLLKKIR